MALNIYNCKKYRKGESKSVSSSAVPTSLLAQDTQNHRWVDETEAEYSNRLEVSTRTLQGILDGTLATVTLSTADKVLTNLGLNYKWHLPPLDEYYSDEYKCPNCSHTTIVANVHYVHKHRCNKKFKLHLGGI